MKNPKGITLIALIITLIVMLILVGVSVSVALNTGLFKSAQGAGKNTQIEADKETQLSNGTVNIGGENIKIEDYINKLSVIPSELQIGDIIEYTPSSNYTSSAKYSVPAEYVGCTGEFYTDMDSTVEWKVIGIEGSTIKIIPKAVSSTEMTITGANGWNNSINALNNVCGAVYGNTTSDKYTATAKSLTVEDINKIAGYTPTPSTESRNASEYGIYNDFPIEYLKEKGVTEFTDAELSQGYAANSSITVEKTSYYYSPEEQSGLNTKFANWLDIDSDRYWLASRGVSTGISYPLFQLAACDYDGDVKFLDLFRKKQNYRQYDAVRPVVTLTPKVAPTLDKTAGEGPGAINYWVFE